MTYWSSASPQPATKGSKEMVAAAVRTISAPDVDHVREQLDAIATMLRRQYPSSRGC